MLCRRHLTSYLVVCIAFCLFGCIGDSGSSDAAGSQPSIPPTEQSLDQQLRSKTANLALTGDPATPRGLSQQTPDQQPLIKLGQLLFFSHSLSGDLSVSCASCHHADFGGSDLLSIGVGVAPVDAASVGPGRVINPDADQDPAADGGPNMHRNSQTVFNSALYDRALLFDGRVFVVDDALVPGGNGQAIRTPESGNVTDTSEANGLLEVFAKFPLTNHNEMRAYLFPETHPQTYRQRLADRLKGQVDINYLSEQGPDNWLSLFRQGFAQPEASADELITVVGMQKALAAYMKSMVFVETPWKQYLEGDNAAISESAKQGALLFLGELSDGGLGCGGCHSGDFFTDESFHNVGFPQLGRGFMRAEKNDVGRWATTRNENDWYAFRVPSLLNVGLTSPYGHAGSFDSLASLLQYHANPVQGLTDFDFSLSQLHQYQDLNSLYPDAQRFTQEAQAEDNFASALNLLPQRALTDQEITDLTAFLHTLTDVCINSSTCRSQWIPTLDEDPDGNLLVRDVNPVANPNPTPDPDPDPQTPPEPADYPVSIALDFPEQTALSTFQEIDDCSTSPASVANLGANTFVLSSMNPLFGMANIFGLPLHPHGFSLQSWGLVGGVNNIAAATTMQAGGVTAAYINDDCWLDLLYTGGDLSGTVYYENRGGSLGFDKQSLLAEDPGGQFTGIAVADLNGDYRSELVFANLGEPNIPIYAQADDAIYYQAATLPMSRYTFGISFGDYNNDQYLDFFLGHWAPTGNVLTAPALWKNDQGDALMPQDVEAQVSSAQIGQVWNFVPQFADINRDGHTDLLVVSDFGASVVLQNDGQNRFNNITDRTVITDENGMGSALGDFDNDGDLDWFVSSIHDDDGEVEGNWGITGNRLYRNVSTTENIIFEDATGSAGVAEGNWGWGACFADFNNDGFLDIFHVNGMGNIPAALFDDGADTFLRDRSREIHQQFLDARPVLFMNNGDGTFTDSALSWGLMLPHDGRGISCLDYDRDGDMDLVLLHHSVGLQLYTNQMGLSGNSHFLSVRLIGQSPNTNAVGAEVFVSADLGEASGNQTQMRASLANSNYNGQNPSELHFGMGAASKADTVTIHWHTGEQWVCRDVPVNQHLILDQRTPQAYPQCVIE